MIPIEHFLEIGIFIIAFMLLIASAVCFYHKKRKIAIILLIIGLTPIFLRILIIIIFIFAMASPPYR